MQTPSHLTISTVFGEGRLVGYRPEDSMYIVELQNSSATMYTRNVDGEAAQKLLRSSSSVNSDVIQVLEPVALLQDSSGRPLFPRLHRMRLAGRGQVAAARANASERLGRASLRVAAARAGASEQLDKTSQQMRLARENASKRIDRMLNSPEQRLVQTRYGSPALVLEFRHSDGVCVVKLPWGATLYATRDDVEPIPEAAAATAKMAMSALELNAAYENSERKRRVELERDCTRAGIPCCTEDTAASRCFACLQKEVSELSRKQEEKEGPKQPAALLSKASGQPRFPRLYKLRLDGRELIQQSSQQVSAAAQAKKEASLSPCLLCGSPTCAGHASAAFRREGITVCSRCIDQLECDFESARTPKELEEQAKNLAELYGRVLLLLRYSSRFLPETADALGRGARKRNQVGAGSSGVGLVGGALGVAAACTILTPIGPPLLVASLVFGGGATAVQTGSEAHRYYSEPNQLANRVLALHGVVRSILAATERMRDTALLPYLDLAASSLMAVPHDSSGAAHKVEAAAVRMGGPAATGVAAGLAVRAETMAAGATTAKAGGRIASRSITAAARTARFARFAGGALSAAVLVLEARELSRTLDQIHKGSPCEKAESLREIHAKLNDLPSAASVEGICQSYAKVRSKQLLKTQMTQFVAKSQEDYLSLVEEVVSSLEATQGDRSVLPKPSSGEEPSLLERVEHCKEQEARQKADPVEATQDGSSALPQPSSGKPSPLERVKYCKRQEAKEKDEPDWLVL